MLTRLEEPNRLIIETCIATGARISEILGLKWKHVNFAADTIKIEQRLWRQDLDRPKTEGSRRTLGEVAAFQRRCLMKGVPNTGIPQWLPRGSPLLEYESLGRSRFV
jgi:integrase